MLAIKAPGFGDRRKEMLRDIAILTGGNAITKELGRKLETTNISDLGQVRRLQKERNNPNIGFNVMTGQYKDLLASGIVDPAKVTRSALQNAASIAAMILTTEALITDAQKEKRMSAPPPMPDY